MASWSRVPCEGPSPPLAAGVRGLARGWRSRRPAGGYLGPVSRRTSTREDCLFVKLARPERFELPTTWFVARYSIQLSYGRVSGVGKLARGGVPCQGKGGVAEREGFEPSMELLTPYSLSRGAPSTCSAISPGERSLG